MLFRFVTYLLLPLSVYGVVSPGGNGTYHVDQWGADMRPTKDEMGTDMRKHLPVHTPEQIKHSGCRFYHIPVTH